MANQGWTPQSNDEGLMEGFVHGGIPHFGRTRPREVGQRTPDRKSAYGKAPARSILGIALLGALSAVTIMLFPVPAMAAPQAPLKINVTLKPVNARPDSQINILWSFANHTDLIGSVAYYLNNQPLPVSPQPAVGTAWKPGTLYPGPQNVAVVPGVNQITVFLLNIHTGALNNTTPKLTDIEVGKAPSPGRGTSASVTAGIDVLAAGGAHVTPSIPPSSLAKDGLTAASRR